MKKLVTFLLVYIAFNWSFGSEHDNAEYFYSFLGVALSYFMIKVKLLEVQESAALAKT